MGDGLAINILLILLTAIIGFLGWVAISINKATSSLASLKTDFDNIKSLIADISADLKAIAQHDLMIAVLKTKVENLENDNTLIFEKFREIERDEKNPVHRGQSR